jgi:hypothetical protein
MSRGVFRLVGVWNGCWVVRDDPCGLKHVGAKNTKTKSTNCNILCF